jgi:hypothetical protein
MVETYLRRARRNVIPWKGVNPELVEVTSIDDVVWTDRHGNPALPPNYDELPDPSAVLKGDVSPDLDMICFKSSETFVSGGLMGNFEAWKELFGDMEGFQEVGKWLGEGIDLYDFFTPFVGEYKGRQFDSMVPPCMYFQNAPNCGEYQDFVEEAITKGLRNGAIRCMGKMGRDPPPRVVNPISVNVESTKKRLVLSMKGVNLFCKDCPFSLHSLVEIVKGLEPRGFFALLDDVNGYKQMRLTERSWEFCGFQWGGYYFVDTCLPFGWKCSAYVYTMTGRMLSRWLRDRGVHTSLWIDDRFVGSAQ